MSSQFERAGTEQTRVTGRPIRQAGAAGEDLPVVTRPRPTPRVVSGPRAPWLFAAAMGIGFAIAATAGIGLGVVAAAETWIGETRWSSAVQGHGRIQLFSFVAVFVTALSFEFLVRFNGQPMLPVGRRVAVLALLGAGALLMAAGQLISGGSQGLITLGALSSVAGAAGYLAIVARVGRARSFKEDLHPLYFRAAASWLLVGSLLALAGAMDEIAGIIPLAESRAMSEVILRGFVLNIVVAVALRAFPGHLELGAITPRRQMLLFGSLNGAVLIWLLGSSATFFPTSGELMQIGDVLLGVSIFAFTWWSGVMGGFRWPSPGVARYQTFIPMAWLGALGYAAALIVFGVMGGVHERTLYQEGAVRHMVMFGFMAPLMLAFAHIVLARFGTGHIPYENVLSLAFVAVMIAWPLRVLPVLFVDAPSTPGRMVISTAGMLAAGAFIAGAFVCIATARRMAEVQRVRMQHAHGGAHLVH